MRVRYDHVYLPKSVELIVVCKEESTAEWWVLFEGHACPIAEYVGKLIVHGDCLIEIQSEENPAESEFRVISILYAAPGGG